MQTKESTHLLFVVTALPCRLFRKDVHAVDGYITLLQLDKLVKRYGVKLSEQNKVMITKYYALNQREAALLLPVTN